MGVMVSSEGRAVGIDHIPELQALATRNIQEDRPDLLESGRVVLVGKFTFFWDFIFIYLF